MTFMLYVILNLCVFCLSGRTLPGGVRCSSDDRLVRPPGDPGGARRLWSGAGGRQVSLKHTEMTLCVTLFHVTVSFYAKFLK